mmetsp:Transcript_8048/g.20687  ORF Transcript_8048/g.20687 Transcript_8048/m.20687 type:complete len:116 (+) Transcript_8048:1368-1715(+)
MRAPLAPLGALDASQRQAVQSGMQTSLEEHHGMLFITAQCVPAMSPATAMIKLVQWATEAGAMESAMNGCSREQLIAARRTLLALQASQVPVVNTIRGMLPMLLGLLDWGLQGAA